MRLKGYIVESLMQENGDYKQLRSAIIKKEVKAYD